MTPTLIEKDILNTFPTPRSSSKILSYYTAQLSSLSVWKCDQTSISCVGYIPMGRDSQMKRSGMLVVSLRDHNCKSILNTEYNKLLSNIHDFSMSSVY